MQIARTTVCQAHAPFDTPTSCITALAHSIDHDGCAVATTDGALFFLGAATHQLEELGRFDAAVIAMAWSPAGDMLALATAAGQLVFMPDLREVETEVSLQQTLKPGGGAKTLAAAETFELGSVALAWRGDGAFLATASQAPDECALCSAPLETLE